MCNLDGVTDWQSHAPFTCIFRRSSCLSRDLIACASRGYCLLRALSRLLFECDAPVSFGTFPVSQVVFLCAVAVGGAAQVFIGAARLGSADGSAARLGDAAWLGGAARRRGAKRRSAWAWGFGSRALLVGAVARRHGGAVSFGMIKV